MVLVVWCCCFPLCRHAVGLPASCPRLLWAGQLARTRKIIVDKMMTFDYSAFESIEE